MTTTLVNLEGVIDLNAMFSLNYNFDYLKCIIDALINANKNTNLKLRELDDANKEKTDKINE
jgi:hypothetical protein